MKREFFKKTGIIYRNKTIYKLMMFMVYRSHYMQKYKAVADEIPDNSVVVDLCCGDAVIAPLVQERGCKYIGLDINPRFVEGGKARGLDIRIWDGYRMEIPDADVVCIQSALYHFIPNDETLVKKMYEKARKKIIVSEPVEHISMKGPGILTKMTIWFTRVNGRDFKFRHTEESLESLFSKLPKGVVKKARLGRELIITVDKAA